MGWEAKAVTWLRANAAEWAGELADELDDRLEGRDLPGPFDNVLRGAIVAAVRQWGDDVILALATLLERRVLDDVEEVEAAE